MVSPFRLSPPRQSPLRLIDRPRLIEVLEGRFDRRVTMLQAGAGFGKTTVLSQALEQSEDDPMRVDRWLGCAPRDDDPGEFAAGLRDAMGIQGNAGDTIQLVCDAVWKLSPAEVSIVVDDVHYISPGGESANLLEQLLSALPANGHLVLAGRKEAPISVSRLLANGQAVVIAESDLAFDGPERSSFLALRGATEAPRETSGWPALLELAASAGRDRVGTYLWEEVLDGLSDERRRGLARMACLEWLDTARITAFTGREQDVASFVEDLPLTSFEPNGAARLHGLWAQVLASVPAEWTDEEFTRAREFLVADSYFQEAIELCLHNQRSDDLAKVLDNLISRIWFDVDYATLSTVIATLPDDVRFAPVGKCIEGFKRMLEDPAHAEPYLRAAYNGFLEADDARGQYIALGTLSLVGFFEADSEKLWEVAEKASHVQDPEATAMHYVLRSTSNFVGGRLEEALACYEKSREFPGNMGGSDAATAAMIYIELGLPERATATLEQALPSSGSIFHAALLGAYFDANWLRGRQTVEELSGFDGGLPQEAKGHAHNASVFLSLLAYHNLSAGRTAIAERHVADAAPLIARGLGKRAECAYEVARMALAVAQGDEEEAAREIERSIEGVDDVLLRNRHLLRAAPIAWIVSPEARRRFAAADLGPCYAEGVAAADALVSYRESGDVMPAGELHWEDHKTFSIYLVPCLLLELAIVGSAAGNAGATSVAESLAGNHYEVLVRLAESDTTTGVAGIVKDMMRRVPAKPAEKLELHAMGPMELVRDGIATNDPTLRRERVRALLCYLLENGRVERNEVSAAVWPDLDERERANNLRVSLSYLRKMLEPNRPNGAPSYFLPQHAEHIELTPGDCLLIDATRFDQTLDQAEAKDAAGDPRAALEEYGSALALYRGEYLADAPDPAWGNATRTRLRIRFVKTNLRVAELQLGSGDSDGALESARRALSADPLSERAHRMLALAHLRKDDVSAAREAIEAGLAALKEAGLEPRSDTRRLASRLGVAVRQSPGADEQTEMDPRASDTDERDAMRRAEDVGLSPRELEVVRLVDEGLSNNEIASRLFVAPSTIKKHLENVYDKLGVRRRTQAVQIVREQGLLG